MFSVILAGVPSAFRPILFGAHNIDFLPLECTKLPISLHDTELTIKLDDHCWCLHSKRN